MSKEKGFASKAGLIAATVGSAVGLGNIWRFPNEVQSNGGAAFLIIYVACMLIIGVPVMLAEFSLGRGTGSDAVGAFRKLTPRGKWWLAGAVALLAAYLINAFYTVVAGWTVEYLWTSLTGELYQGIDTSSPEAMEDIFASRMRNSIMSVWTPVIFVGIILVINIAILMRGVQKGIEKMSNILMPLLFGLMVVLCVVSLSLPGASAGLAFFLYPDFSAITPEVFLNALGQAFFSLSLGMGILVTYASYFPKKDNLLSTAGSVVAGDFLVAFLTGCIIFPAVLTFGLTGDEGLQSTALVFITLPEVFAQMPATRLWSVIFFLLLFIAALTSCISISEVGVKFCQEKFAMSRRKAVFAVLLPLFILSPLCSMSLGVLDDFRIFGKNLFDFLDFFATNCLLPVAAFFTCLYIGWRLPAKFLRDQLTNRGRINCRIATPIIFIIKWIAPLCIACIFIYAIMP